MLRTKRDIRNCHQDRIFTTRVGSSVTTGKVSDGSTARKNFLAPATASQDIYSELLATWSVGEPGPNRIDFAGLLSRMNRRKAGLAFRLHGMPKERGLRPPADPLPQDRGGVTLRRNGTDLPEAASCGERCVCPFFQRDGNRDRPAVHGPVQRALLPCGRPGCNGRREKTAGVAAKNAT